MSAIDRRGRIRKALDTWHFWVGVAYFGLVLLMVALWVNFGRVQQDTARTQRIVLARHADVIANADAQYQQCVASIPTLHRVNDFLAGVVSVQVTLIRNSIATHRVTPSGTPLYLTQAQNIARLRKALSDEPSVHFPIPTAKSCLALKAKLEAKQ